MCQTRMACNITGCSGKENTEKNKLEIRQNGKEDGTEFNGVEKNRTVQNRKVQNKIKQNKIEKDRIERNRAEENRREDIREYKEKIKEWTRIIEWNRKLQQY